MVRFVVFLIALIAFTFTMWENVKNTVSITFLGSPVFENAPVLLVILTSMLAGILLVLPFVWSSRLKLKRIQHAQQKKVTKPDTSALLSSLSDEKKSSVQKNNLSGN